MNLRAKTRTLLAAAGAVALVAACGGGGGSAGTPPFGSNGAATTLSSGTITAFGSVFVNGHRFDTGAMRVIDDDTDAVASSASGLEVGMSVEVKAAANSTAANPVAAELHLHPLARGVVDANDDGAGTLTVMGQTVQITAATNFSDHRACVEAGSNPCSAVTGQGDLLATTGSGSAAVPGSYVTVHGYLYTADASSSTSQIVATLVSVGDAPTGAVPAAYKAEGVVSSPSSGSVKIGGLTVDLSSAICRSGGATVACAGAYSAGQVVSVFASTRPALPATTLLAGGARLAGKLPVQTNGASIELEGKVSTVSTSPAAFVVRGVSIDASALGAGSTLPAVGDIVRVVGTVASGGEAVSASSVVVLRAASSRAYGFEGDFSAVAAATAASTYTLSLLGQTITVDAGTRLADRQSHGWMRSYPTANPFNITTFQAYLAASTSRHLLVLARTDTAGNLVAQTLTILPASTHATVAGPVDASPAPVNGTGSAVPSTFSVHGVAVRADPADIRGRPFGHGTTATVAAGDTVVVRGSFASGTLTVSGAFGANNGVIDLGVVTRRDYCGL